VAVAVTSRASWRVASRGGALGVRLVPASWPVVGRVIATGGVLALTSWLVLALGQTARRRGDGPIPGDEGEGLGRGLGLKLGLKLADGPAGPVPGLCLPGRATARAVGRTVTGHRPILPARHGRPRGTHRRTGCRRMIGPGVTWLSFGQR
jgi:hypothetical protein